MLSPMSKRRLLTLRLVRACEKLTDLNANRSLLLFNPVSLVYLKGARRIDIICEHVGVYPQGPGMLELTAQLGEEVVGDAMLQILIGEGFLLRQDPTEPGLD